MAKDKKEVLEKTHSESLEAGSVSGKVDNKLTTGIHAGKKPKYDRKS